MNIKGYKIPLIATAAVLVLVLIYSATYIVQEGHVGIIKRAGKAITQVDPGFHFKIPIVDTVDMIEIRQRKSNEELSAATSKQLPIKALVSINWTVNKESALELYRKYGSLSQFEDRVLDPKLRSVAKAALAKFTAENIIKNRSYAVAEIQEMMTIVMSSFPVVVDSPQIENLTLPEKYVKAVEDKMKAREDAERAKFELDKQKTEAQQKVQTAEAERDALKARADGEAYSRLTTAEAEAKAINLVNEQLTKSPLYIDLVKAKVWDGKLP